MNAHKILTLTLALVISTLCSAQSFDSVIWIINDGGADVAVGQFGNDTVTLSGGNLTGATPINSDIVELLGSPGNLAYTLTFSRPVENPVLRIRSLASILTFSGVSLLLLPGADASFQVSDITVSGTVDNSPGYGIDSNGDVMLEGIYTSVNFTAFYVPPAGPPFDGISLGIDVPQVTIPEPATYAAIIGAVSMLGVLVQRWRNRTESTLSRLE